MLKMLQGPAFPGFGQRWPETPRLAAAQHQPQLPTKGNFTVDSILSLRSPTVPPDGGSWQPAAAALPPGLLSYYPSLYHLYTPQGAQAPQEQLGTPRGGYPCSDPRCMPGLCLSRSPSAPQLPLAPWRSGPCRTKRVRTVFTPDQLERLEQEFLRQQYMVGTERAALASILHLAETQVKVWFQNRRIKWRKQSLEQKKAKLSKCGALEPDPQEQTDDKASDDDNVEIEV